MTPMDEREAKNRARNLLWNGSVMNDRTLADELHAAWREGFAAGQESGLKRNVEAVSGPKLLAAAVNGARWMRDDILACLNRLRQDEPNVVRQAYIAGIIDAVRDLDPNQQNRERPRNQAAPDGAEA